MYVPLGIVIFSHRYCNLAHECFVSMQFLGSLNVLECLHVYVLHSTRLPEAWFLYQQTNQNSTRREMQSRMAHTASLLASSSIPRTSSKLCSASSRA